VVIIRYDTEADATYVTLRHADVARTIEVIDSFLWVDLDEAGLPVGIEFLDAPADVDETALACIAERFPSTDTAGIKAALAGHAVRPAV
jgi:uncharacterized protein YuzE